jgi:hypothetical protein
VKLIRLGKMRSHPLLVFEARTGEITPITTTPPTPSLLFQNAARNLSPAPTPEPDSTSAIPNL